MKVNRFFWNEVVLHGITLMRETSNRAGIETTRRIILFDDRYYQVEQVFDTITDCFEIEAY